LNRGDVSQNVGHDVGGGNGHNDKKELLTKGQQELVESGGFIRRGAGPPTG